MSDKDNEDVDRVKAELLAAGLSLDKVKGATGDWMAGMKTLTGKDGLLWPRTCDPMVWSKAWLSLIAAHPEKANDPFTVFTWFAGLTVATWDSAEKHWGVKRGNKP